LRANSRALARWFHRHIKQPSSDIRVPAFIRDAGRDIRAAYLAGLLDADGRVRKDGGIDQLTTVYRVFADDVVTLLAGLGVGCRLTGSSAQKRRDRGENAQDFWTVSIVGNTNRRAYTTACCRLSEKLAGREFSFCSPVDFSFPIRWGSSTEGYGTNGNITVEAMRYDRPLLPSPVVSIAPGRMVDTYDIEVLGLQSFTTNGIVVHNSAMISLSNPSDDRMRRAKSGQWWVDAPQRALANNSAAYTERPDFGVFMTEWLALHESKSGERGIFNREATKAKAAAIGRKVEEFGTNPCSEISLRSAQMCVAGSTPMVTASHGIVPIDSLVGQKSVIWNGEEWTEVTVRKTGAAQKIVRVHLSDGSYLDCTPDHRWSVKTRFQKEWREVQAGDLSSYSKYSVQVEPSNVSAISGTNILQDAYTLGLAVGDGCVYKGSVLVDLFGTKIDLPCKGSRHAVVRKEGYAVDSCRVTTDLDPALVRSLKTDAAALLALVGAYTRGSLLGFFAGWLDADGSNVPGGGVRLYLSREDRARAVQLVLTSLGIRSSVCLMQEKGAKTNKGVRSQAMWYLQITDCGTLPCLRLDTSRGHKSRFKGKFQSVRRVEELPGLHDTYCFNEPRRHKGLFGNVLTFQCNLSEVVIRPEDTLDTLKEKVRLATIVGTIQSDLTKFRYLRPRWAANCREERLLGVSLTGICDHPFYGNPDEPRLAQDLRDLREYARQTNLEWSDKLGIEPSAAITCVKPSGTVSQLVDCASGIHPRFARYYIRRVRAGAHDPIAKFLSASGLQSEPDTAVAGNVVFSFPCASPTGARTQEDMTALGMCKLWAVYNKHWADHSVSATVQYSDDEYLGLGQWVWEHFDEITGLSFLPRVDHTYQQAPYEACDEATFKRMAAAMPELDWSALAAFESEDNTEGQQTLACSGGSCEI
jgi:ribonucleotide reductase, class II